MPFVRPLNRITITLSSLVVMLSLAGCADDGDAWTKPGATEVVVSADLGECRSQARALTRRPQRP